MIDVETLGTYPGCVILTIGAVKFYRHNKLRPLKNMDSFYRRISISSCEKIGLSIDKDTLGWWEKQDKDVYYEAVKNPDRVPIKEVLIQFSEWLRGAKYFWCQGLSFDCPILEEAYRRCGIEVPWKFWVWRDTRTLYDVAQLRKEDKPVTNNHNSLEDCYNQVICVKLAYKKL